MINSDSKIMKKKIVYILGTPRCGSTLISNILNEIDGVLSVGELHYIWERGIKENWVCGNGKSFSDEKFWIDVLNNFRRKVNYNYEEIYKLSKNPGKMIRTRHYLLNRKLTIYCKFKDSFLDYINILEKLYDSIFEVSGSNVIVDSSKTFRYGLLISNFNKYDIYFLHIVRDPRAVTYSRVFRKKIQFSSKNSYFKMGEGMTVNKSIRNLDRN